MGSGATALNCSKYARSNAAAGISWAGKLEITTQLTNITALLLGIDLTDMYQYRHNEDSPCIICNNKRSEKLYSFIDWELVH